MSTAKEEVAREGGADELTEAMEQLVELAPIFNRWAGKYTHVFAEPFEWQGERYERLTFNWESLSGRDFIQLDAEARRRRGAPSLEANDYPIPYLAGMAARACTERNENGKRALGTDAFDAMPGKDCLRICRQARLFLAVSAL